MLYTAGRMLFMGGSMRKIFIFLTIGLLAASAIAVPPYSSDTGKITTLFTNTGGAVAIQLDGGFPHAVADGQCPAANVYAGFTTADPMIKSALLAAKATGTTITVIITGCANGGWFGLHDIYMQ